MLDPPWDASLAMKMDFACIRSPLAIILKNPNGDEVAVIAHASRFPLCVYGVVVLAIVNRIEITTMGHITYNGRYFILHKNDNNPIKIDDAIKTH